MPRKVKSQVLQEHTQEEQTPQEQEQESETTPPEVDSSTDTEPLPEVEVPEVEPSPETPETPEVDSSENIESEPQEQESETTPPEVDSSTDTSTQEQENTENPPSVETPPTEQGENTEQEQGGDNSQENTQEQSEIIPLPQPPMPPPLPDTPTTPNLPSDESTEVENIENDFIQKLETSLEQNTSWKEQVYMTLQGLSLLLNRFNTIKDIMSKTHKGLLTQKNDIDSKKEALDTQYNHLLKTIQLYGIYFDDLKAALSANADIILRNMQTCIEQALLCEQTLTDTKGLSADILEYRSDILLTLEKLKALDLQKQELLTIYAKGEQFLKDIKLTQEAILSSFSQKHDEIKAELSTHKGELITQLTQTKELLEANLREQETQALELISAKIQLVDTKIVELEQNFINKKAQLDLAHSEITNARNTLQEAKESFETKANECESKLQELTDNHIITLNNAKESHIISLNEATRQHSENLEELKTNYKQELDSVCAGEIAILKRYIEQIQARTTQFGANFKRVTYLENATFTPPEDNIYYYVFLQGGSGADNSVTQGGITSFGTHLSARGGLGGENGKGMRGECVSGFVEINSTSPIEVSVGSGGICIVSYTSKEAQ